MKVNYQLAVEHEGDLPDKPQIQATVNAVLAKVGMPQAELAVRVVGETEILDLNQRYRNKESTTNVLSFPFDRLQGIEENYVGDVVICYPVAKAEAAGQRVEFASHFSHLLVHGVLHLFGYDHQHDEEAELMENLEREILSSLDC
ncbi:MAG: rRNA maturation RNase YbeY [Gammaproteobacteria bacterium]|nr:rRNA maturation RNase YbeY [Gammaproteobacteria bacterium]MCY4227459.1 rRNA maturation RNase YbeY [Gammaproteobacteria bacterium]MCY4313711.1 rRNA maturation RNase YbeY [Gammaproteobacteria bacterium]